MTVSACLIVKNEARNLPRCLDSIRRGVDEIVVLDTGSTDDTCEVARKHGADVVVSEPEWSIEIAGMRMLSDFGAARNRSLELASGDWALIVDADHAYVWPTLDAVREATRSDQHDTFTLWYHMAARPDARPVDVANGRKRLGKPHGAVALFRRVDGPWYDGVIHETVAAWEERRGKTRGHLPRSRVADYGQSPDERAKLGKDLRNVLLLERATRVRPEDPIPWSYLAMEYATKRDLKARAVCEAAWERRDGLVGAHLLRLVVARCHTALANGLPDVAWETLTEWDAREGEEHPDVLTLRGLVAERLGLTRHAIEMYRAAAGPQPKEWVIRYILSDTARERLQALGAA